ncbi:MAG: hypothetical protein A2X61_00270 [Ignavibacteria bacterium GWB2_35_12]|nr:MAG: hypothetical protein A2X63_02080 [Ignavibacteria bacterium GWA2_35_8]OGU41730.1 MAG: hypothetical protein A2X61_00270 [Ignavibacteria bacterium GWB2_35_12]OGU90586.1 MAG: hypothetical protein A2220_12945 [Ignavibacteria bacterium RIFOXYA2_FULL_35_10]OGV23341.1 MAG: hypothetical protein A2475_06775 [Ignavibacteria bacterium RIFOXYC2_FULL_35_21]
MKRLPILFTIILAFILYSCGKEADDMKKAFESMEKIADAGKNIEAESKLADVRKKERISRGDTLAMPYQELQKFLPASISGYTAEEPEGTSFNMPPMSYSQAVCKYVAPGTNGGDNYVTVTLLDYNQAGDMYVGLTALWQIGFSTETKDRMEKTFSPGFDNVSGYESLDKNNKRATVNYGIAWRFFLTVEAGNQTSTDFVKSVANSIDIKKLSGM